MLTPKVLASWRRVSIAGTNDPLNPPDPRHPHTPSFLDDCPAYEGRIRRAAAAPNAIH
jgi:hypothetical protein